MIETPLDDLEARAEALGARLADAQGLAVSIAATEATVGGGSTPGVTLRSRALAVEVPWLFRHPRSPRCCGRGIPPVIGRIIDDRLLLDLRTVHATEDDDLADAILRGVARDASRRLTSEPRRRSLRAGGKVRTAREHPVRRPAAGRRRSATTSPPRRRRPGRRTSRAGKDA